MIKTSNMIKNHLYFPIYSLLLEGFLLFALLPEIIRSSPNRFLDFLFLSGKAESGLEATIGFFIYYFFLLASLLTVDGIGCFPYTFDSIAVFILVAIELS